MVGRIYKPIRCWNYVSNHVPYPILKCRIESLTGFEYGPIDIPIDTGYSGSILVPSSVYDIFKVAELPPKYWRKYTTLMGELIMKVSRGYIVIGDIKMETTIESPLYGYGKFLIGRQILNKLIIVLDGLSKVSCLSEGK